MTGEPKTDTDEREVIAEQFDTEIDPLKKYEAEFWQLESEKGIDPYEMFLEDVVRGSSSERTIAEYEKSIAHFKSFISDKRHPACASDEQVIEFATHEIEEIGNQESTVGLKLSHVKRAYDYFGRESVFPHTGEYNPVEAAKLKLDLSESNESSEYPRLTIPELREVLSPITHLFALTVILLGFKLGMRQGEIRNVSLQDIHLTNSELQNHYETLGTHPQVTEYQNAIYIPSRYERPGNKSHEPRVLPLDDEMRHCLTQYLLIRPDCGESEVFVSQTDHERIRDKDGINRYWRRQIRPQIEIEEHHDEITSHFGRHYFTTYWKVEQNVAREYVQYMRGDKVGKSNSNESIDDYLHTYYEDIEELYREEIYKLLM